MAFRMHGVGLRIDCESSEVHQALARRLDAFAVNAAEGEADDVVISISGPGAPSLFRPVTINHGRVVYDGPEGVLRYLEGEDRLVSNYASRVHLDLAVRDRRMRMAVTGSHPADLMLAAYPLFSASLVEILKRHRRYSLHAACVARQGSGLLFAGTSGSGKSTLAVAFAQRGFDILADDTVFLDDTRLRALAFPDEIDITDATISMFRELEHLLSQPRRPGRPKRSIRPEALGANSALSCTPAALVFPRIANTARSRLEAMEPADALRELLPNVLLTDPTSSQAHLDALGRLVRGVPAFVLATGQDLAQAVDLLEPIITPT